MVSVGGCQRRIGEAAKLVDRVRACEIMEGLLRIAAMREIGAEHAFDATQYLRNRQRRVKFAAETALGAGAAADIDDVSFDRLLADLGAEQADVADEMLRAGVRATREVDVDRLVERDAVLEMRRQRQGLALGVGGGEFAAG